jgi:predicted ATP-grasp superfamily ATP-dependent carboligase
MSNSSPALVESVSWHRVSGVGALRVHTNSGVSVLITDEHYKSSLGLVRHLGRKGVRVSVVAVSKSSLACRSHYCQEVVPADSPGEEAIVEATLRAIRRRQFDLVMPVSYPITRALAQRKDEVRQYAGLEVAPLACIERAANKTAMMQLAEMTGVPVPKWCVPASAEEAIRFATECGFPVVAKPQRESPGRSVRIAQNCSDLRALWPADPSVPSAYAEPPLMQEFIPGRGCGFFATYQNGVCKRIFMHRRVREYPAAGGVSSCAQSFYDANLETHGRRMLDALGWHGVAMVEFRQDSRDGEFKLMEVNPKFWGSLDLALASGADFPGDLCRMALGETLDFTDAYDRELRFQWPLSTSGDLYHLWTRPGSFFEVARDFLNPNVKSNLRLDDLRPTLTELRQIGGLFRRFKRG